MLLITLRKTLNCKAVNGESGEADFTSVVNLLALAHEL